MLLGKVLRVVGHSTVVGKPRDRFVERAIVGDEVLGLAPGEVTEFVEILKVRVGCRLRGLDGKGLLDNGTELPQILRVFHGYRRNSIAAARENADQLFDCQSVQCVADGRPADFEPLGQRPLSKLGTRRNSARNDISAEVFINLVAREGRRFHDLIQR